ncbi:MAG: hypothetical protein AAFX87_04560 [Bacteroidota bacterium]
MKLLVKLLFALVVIACLGACTEESIFPTDSEEVILDTEDNGSGSGGGTNEEEEFPD